MFDGWPLVVSKHRYRFTAVEVVMAKDNVPSGEIHNWRNAELYRTSTGGDNPPEGLEDSRFENPGTQYVYFEDSDSGDEVHVINLGIENSRLEPNLDLMPDFQGQVRSRQLFDYTPAELVSWETTRGVWPSDSPSPVETNPILQRGAEVINADIRRNHRQMLSAINPRRAQRLKPYIVADVGDIRGPGDDGEYVDIRMIRDSIREYAKEGTWERLPIQMTSLMDNNTDERVHPDDSTSLNTNLSRQQFFNEFMEQKLPGMEDY